MSAHHKQGESRNAQHGQSWDRFSVYLTVSDRNMRELESLILRIVKPVGNKRAGKFARSENLKTRFRHDVRSALRRREDELRSLGPRTGAGKTARGAKRPMSSRKPALAGVFPRAVPLWGEYKGTDHKARLRDDGLIRDRGKPYDSPSATATAACKRKRNGWSFWHFKNDRGDWVPLRALRR